MMPNLSRKIRNNDINSTEVDPWHYTNGTRISVQ